MWTEHIDIYCERLDTSFWAEPLNALTNISFIFASFMAIYIHRKNSLKNPIFLFLAFYVSLIGVGSFLFHTFANTWSELADTIPIWTFVIFFVFFSIRVVFQASWFKTIRIMIIVFICAYIGLFLSKTDNSSDEAILNGSLQYAPALFFMLVYSISLYFKRRTISKYGFLAVFVFFISLSFRTLDMYMCENISIGTHFVWHILNALMLFLLLYTFHLSIKEDEHLQKV